MIDIVVAPTLGPIGSITKRPEAGSHLLESPSIRHFHVRGTSRATEVGAEEEAVRMGKNWVDRQAS